VELRPAPGLRREAFEKLDTSKTNQNISLIGERIGIQTSKYYNSDKLMNIISDHVCIVLYLFLVSELKKFLTGFLHYLCR